MGYALVIVKPNTLDWQSYHDIRRTILFEGRGRTTYDPHYPDETNPANIPLLLKLNDKPLATTRLDRRAEGIGVIRLVAVVASEQRQGHGRVLASMVEGFVRQQNMHTLYVNSAPDAVGYYRKLGWEPYVWDVAELKGIASDCLQHRKFLTPQG